MGSSSDWPKIKNCALILKEFGVEFDVRVFSAHRTPKALEAFVKSAPERGVKAILAAAGGAAHLAGVIASMTVLPVIGIPVETNLCGGLDSMLSMIQMPGDIPVATVGVGSGGAKNAGILAVEMEAAALYTLAAEAHVQALALFTVSDHLLTGEACSAEERQTTFNDMIKIALETAIED